MLTRHTIQNVRSLHSKSGRDSAQAFIVEGPKAVAEFLISSLNPLNIYANSEWIDLNAAQLQKRPLPVSEIGEKDLQRISALKTANQVVGIFEKPIADATKYNSRTELCLVLDEIQDPGNMGTIIRCADWFGIKHIFCSLGCADPYAPKVVQATMGSLPRISVVSIDLYEFIKQNNSATIYAAVLEGASMYQHQGVSTGILLIGNESRGISPRLLHRANHKITIPRLGQAESLNAGVATGIILSWLTAPGST